VVWAHFGVGDVYHQWALHLKKEKQDFKLKKDLALQAYQISLKKAQTDSLDKKGVSFIQKKIDELKALNF